MAKTIDMTEGKPTKLLIQFALPLVIGNLFQQAYTLADRVIVGQFVGANAFSAVGATTALSNLFTSVCVGMSIGTGVLVSQYYGAKDEKGVAKAIANSTYINVLLAIITSIIALLFAEPLLRLLKTPESLMKDALAYLLVYIGGLLAVSAYYTPFSILRALGDSKTPLIFLVFCSLLNIVLDIIFVVPLHMGVIGAAVATILSQALAAVLCLVYAFGKVPYMRMAVTHRKIDKRMILQTLKIGLPTSAQYALIYVSSIVLQGVVNGFGESTIGAFTAVSQMELLVQQIYAALGAAMVTYTGQNIGAGKIDRVKSGVKSATMICVVTSAILLAIFFGFGNMIMKIFVPDEEIISISAAGIRITSIFFMALGTVQIFRYLLSGAGDSVYSLVNGGIEIVARIGLVYLLTAIPFIGMWGIFLTTGLTWLITAVFAIVRYKGGAWKNKSLVNGVTSSAEL